MRYGSRVHISKEVHDDDILAVKRTIMEQVEALLDHIVVKEETLSQRDYKLRIYASDTGIFTLEDKPILYLKSDFISNNVEVNENDKN